MITKDMVPVLSSLKAWQTDYRNSTMPLQYHHHHHHVVRPSKSIAIFTSWRHFERSCVHFHTELRPRLSGWRSSWTVWSQIRLGRPLGCCQSAGRQLMAALRARGLYWVGSVPAIWPNRRRRLDVMREVAGSWLVLHLTSSLVTWAVNGTQAVSTC